MGLGFPHGPTALAQLPLPRLGNSTRQMREEHGIGIRPGSSGIMLTEKESTADDEDWGDRCSCLWLL